MNRGDLRALGNVARYTRLLVVGAVRIEVRRWLP